jgi:hypothetical protein
MTRNRGLVAPVLVLVGCAHTHAPQGTIQSVEGLSVRVEVPTSVRASTDIPLLIELSNDSSSRIRVPIGTWNEHIVEYAVASEANLSIRARSVAHPDPAMLCRNRTAEVVLDEGERAVLAYELPSIDAQANADFLSIDLDVAVLPPNGGCDGARIVRTRHWVQIPGRRVAR